MRQKLRCTDTDTDTDSSNSPFIAAASGLKRPKGPRALPLVISETDSDCLSCFEPLVQEKRSFPPLVVDFASEEEAAVAVSVSRCHEQGSHGQTNGPLGTEQPLSLPSLPYCSALAAVETELQDEPLPECQREYSHTRYEYQSSSSSVEEEADASAVQALPCREVFVALCGDRPESDAIMSYDAMTSHDLDAMCSHLRLKRSTLTTIFSGKGFLSSVKIQVLRDILDYLHVDYAAGASKLELLKLIKDFAAFEPQSVSHLTAKGLARELLKNKKLSVLSEKFSLANTLHVAVYHLPHDIRRHQVSFDLMLSLDEFRSILPRAFRCQKYFPSISFTDTKAAPAVCRQLQFQLFRSTGAVDLFSHVSLLLSAPGSRDWTIYEKSGLAESNTDNCIGFKYRALLSEPACLSRLSQYLTVTAESVTIPLQASYCFPFKRVSMVFRLAAYLSPSECIKSFYSEGALDNRSLESLEAAYIRRNRLGQQSFIPAPDPYSPTLVSLADPVTQQPIQHPIKGRTCSHFQCLDASTVLSSDGSLLCPIHCGKSISTANWVYSSDFKALLVQASQMEQEKCIKVDAATIWPNGKFDLHTAAALSSRPRLEPSGETQMADAALCRD